MRDAWTAERIELLRKLWAEGATANAIADRLGGMSRSAVLGKIFRLRLAASDAAATSPAKQNSAAQGQSKRRRPRAVVAGKAPPSSTVSPIRRRRSSKRDKPALRTPTAGSQYKSLLQLTNDSCRWPHGRPGTERFFFCGRPEADLEHGIPYCARHMRRAYVTADLDVENAETMA